MSRVRAPSIAPLYLGWTLSLFEALILGIVQGSTEFLPISSSAHLKIAKYLLSISDGQHLQYVDLVCHGGTLLALGLYLRKEILQVLSSIRHIGLYFLATLPLIPAYFFLKPVREAASSPQFLGYSLALTALLLFLASRREPILGARDENTDLKWKDVLCIGVMQTLALIPGISRSGSTISAARFCGWDWVKGARFSFLLAIPTIFGGLILETMKGAAGVAIPWSCYAAGFSSSFIFGLAGVRFVFTIYEKGKVRPFAWYCLGIGLLSLGIFHA